MKKTAETKNMAHAFIKYARLGLNRIYDDPFDVYYSIKGMCGKNTALAKELLAVHECLLILRVMHENEVLRALNDIYIKPFARKPETIRRKQTAKQGSLSKNEVSYRIQRFALQNFLDVRTVYRRLQKARKIWQELIGYSK